MKVGDRVKVVKDCGFADWEDEWLGREGTVTDILGESAFFHSNEGLNIEVEGDVFFHEDELVVLVEGAE